MRKYLVAALILASPALGLLSGVSVGKAARPQLELQSCRVFPSITSEPSLLSRGRHAHFALANLSPTEVATISLELQPAQGGRPFEWTVSVQPRSRDRFGMTKNPSYSWLIDGFDGFALVRVYGADARVVVETVSPGGAVSLDHGEACQ